MTHFWKQKNWKRFLRFWSNCTCSTTWNFFFRSILYNFLCM